METPYNRTEQLQTARQVLATKLNGKSPRQRGAEKTNLALDWIYRWGWSSPRTIEQVTIDVTEDLHRRIKTACAADGTKMADEIRALLEKHFS